MMCGHYGKSSLSRANRCQNDGGKRRAKGQPVALTCASRPAPRDHRARGGRQASSAGPHRRSRRPGRLALCRILHREYPQSAHTPSHARACARFFAWCELWDRFQATWVRVFRARYAMTPDRLAPTAHRETPRSLTPLIDSLEPLERQVTIYTGGMPARPDACRNPAPRRRHLYRAAAGRGRLGAVRQAAARGCAHAVRLACRRPSGAGKSRLGRARTEARCEDRLNAGARGRGMAKAPRRHSSHDAARSAGPRADRYAHLQLRAHQCGPQDEGRRSAAARRRMDDPAP
jgi:hypothetical protein